MSDATKRLINAAEWVVAVFTDDTLDHERGNLDDWLHELNEAILEAEKEQQNFPQLLPDALEVPACTGYDLGNNEEIGYANGWNDFREDMILNFGLVPEANMPAAGTSEYGAWINAAKNKADMSFSHTGKDRFKWCCAFEQHLRKAL